MAQLRSTQSKVSGTRAHFFHGLFTLVFFLSYAAQPCTSVALASLAQCLANAGIVTGTPGLSTWSTMIAPYNLRLPYQPAAVAYPTTPQQVSSALKCAKTYGVKVQPRGGGHSYAAFGLGGKDGSLVIDMNRFNKIDLDPATNIATVGSGVRLGNLATAIYNKGGRALPHGTCAGVGVGGHATHGGYGFTSRMWGLTVDTIVKLDVVLADGTITTATPTVNSDLFWALCGAGESYGIVTSFYFQTLKAPTNAIQYTANIPAASIATVSQRVKVFLAMQQYGITAPQEMGLQLWLAGNDFSVSGVYWGSREKYNVAINGLLSILPPGTTFDTTEAGWIGTLVSESGASTLDVPLTGYNEHNTFFAKSIMSSQDYPQTEAMLTPFFQFLKTYGNTSGFDWWVLADLYGGIHSKINNKSKLSTASYAHRDSLFTFQFYGETTNNAPFPSKGISFMNSMVASMTSNMDQSRVKAYANYVDPSLSAAEAHRQYYGNDKWDGTPGSGEGRMDKLLRIKKQVDPGNIFWNPQAIGN